MSQTGQADQFFDENFSPSDLQKRVLLIIHTLTNEGRPFANAPGIERIENFRVLTANWMGYQDGHHYFCQVPTALLLAELAGPDGALAFGASLNAQLSELEQAGILNRRWLGLIGSAAYRRPDGLVIAVTQSDDALPYQIELNGKPIGGRFRTSSYTDEIPLGCTDAYWLTSPGAALVRRHKSAWIVELSPMPSTSNSESSPKLEEPLVESGQDDQAVPKQETTSSSGGSQANRVASTNKLPPCRQNAKSVYEWAMSKITGAEDMTISELFDAIHSNPDADDWIHNATGPNSETFGKYLRDAGIKKYNSQVNRAPKISNFPRKSQA